MSAAAERFAGHHDIRATVVTTVLAHEHTLPIGADLAPLFPEGALVRGRTLVCSGPAATSTAMTLVAAAVRAGGWLAVVDIPTFGLDAASETGIPLERVVSISTDSPTCWVDVMATAIDGFDLVMTRVIHRPSTAARRKLANRIRQRSGLVVVLEDDAGMAGGTAGRPAGAIECDGVIDSTNMVWSGLGDGFGHLRRRTVELCASGRRLPGRRRCRLDVA